MYTSHTITYFNLKCTFEFAFKRTLTSFSLFFLVIKTHIVNMIWIVLIDLRFNIFMCFLFRIYCIIFLQEDFIHCLVNKI